MPEIKVTTEKLRELTAKIITTESLMANLHSNFNKARSNICESTDNSAASNIRMKMSTIHIKMAESCNNMLWIRDMLIKSAEAFEEADNQMKKQMDSENSQPGQANTINDSSEAYWDGLLGTTLADIDGHCYSSDDNLSYKSTTYGHGALKGQCTWYAYGRFLEVYGIAFPTALNARTWLDNNEGFDEVNVLRTNSLDALKNQKLPCIRVNDPGAGTGHVSVIENIVYDSNGTVKAIYITESNADGNGDYNAGIDCIVKKLEGSELQDFINNTDGFICAK